MCGDRTTGLALETQQQRQYLTNLLGRSSPILRWDAMCMSKVSGISPEVRRRDSKVSGVPSAMSVESTVFNSAGFRYQGEGAGGESGATEETETLAYDSLSLSSIWASAGNQQQKGDKESWSSLFNNNKKGGFASEDVNVDPEENKSEEEKEDEDQHFLNISHIEAKGLLSDKEKGTWILYFNKDREERLSFKNETKVTQVKIYRRDGGVAVHAAGDEVFPNLGSLIFKLQQDQIINNQLKPEDVFNDESDEQDEGTLKKQPKQEDVSED